MSNSLTPESRGRLIDLKTNLKSLKFGGDQPASGTSNQPYIQTPIPDGTGYGRDGMPLRAGPDFILRGGFLAPLRALKDLSRLAKMFIDTKSLRGIFFTLKENLLSRASVKTQASYGLGYIGGILNQGAYLPIGTLLTAGLGWAGIHLNKNGLNPIGSLGGPSGVNKNARAGALALNPYAVIVKNDQDIYENRLFLLQGFVSRGTVGKDGFGNVKNIKINGGATPTERDTPVLYSYGGGPGSILGIGRTRIYKERPTFNAIRNYQILNSASPRYSGVEPSGTSPLLHGDTFQIYSSDVVGKGLYPSNFMAKVIETNLEYDGDKVVSKIIHKAPTYNINNKALRTNLGDPGQHLTYALGEEDPQRNLFDYGTDASKMRALDKITALMMYEAENADSLQPINDLVQFRIAVVNNEADAGRKATYLHFRAYISGFTDTYGATWNDVQYIGRGNKFKSYGGFNRDIAMSFTVVAASKAELMPMYYKLNYLASSLAPDYTTSGFMRGNMVRITVGGYLFEVPGVITSLTYSIPDDTSWEIGIDAAGNSDSSVKELPHRIEVSLAFSPVENFLPSRQKITFDDDDTNIRSVGSQRFISLADSDYNSYDEISNYRREIKNNSEQDE
jgi:hypothetical protein